MSDSLAAGSPGDPPRPPVPVPWGERLAAMWASRTWSPRRLASTVMVAVAMVAGGAFLLRPPPPPVESQIPMAPDVTAPGSSAPAGDDPVPPTPGAPAPAESDDESVEGTADLTVHAAGAVARPGVHRLPAGSRVVDLVDAAGGLAHDADPDRLNLAAVLTDGARIWVPRRGEEQPPEAVNGDEGGGMAEIGTGDVGAGEPPAPVDLNTATADELDTLPGVGPATAAAIIEHRSTNGPFGSVDELIDVRGIGEAKLEDLRERVRV